ncbi:MAG TPA: hypothetical protein VKT24_04785 [Rhizomicrobium sp.]|nr:hypothetical protein [Rhizomicrobium sp.]
MRVMFVGCAVAAVLAALPTLALAHQAMMLDLAAVHQPNSDADFDVVPVDRGEDLAIQCDGIGTPGSEVSVVMALERIAGETPVGFDAVLLTDEVVGGKTVHVRVPDIADLVDHTVTLKVYVTGTSGTTACNAGHMRIA